MEYNSPRLRPRRILTVILLVIFVEGCAPGAWVRAGTSNLDARRDQALCKMQAGQNGLPTYSTSFAVTANYMTYVNDCMESKGYSGVYPWD